MPYKCPIKQKQRQKEIETSFRGFIVVKYKAMRNRVKGGMTANPKYFIGREIMSREDFTAWTLSDDTYKNLYENWVRSGYDKNLTPSVDRLDSNKGYIVGNIEWVTINENRRRAGLKNKKKVA